MTTNSSSPAKANPWSSSVAFNRGTNSQWGTCFRRDYLTDAGRVFNFDALVSRLALPSREETESALSHDQLNELVMNRCFLRGADEHGDELWPYDTPVDERRT